MLSTIVSRRKFLSTALETGYVFPTAPNDRLSLSPGPMPILTELLYPLVYRQNTKHKAGLHLQNISAEIISATMLYMDLGLNSLTNLNHIHSF